MSPTFVSFLLSSLYLIINGQVCEYDWDLFKANRCVYKIYEAYDFKTNLEKCSELNATLITLVNDQDDIDIYKLYLHPFYIAINVKVEIDHSGALMLKETKFLYTNDSLPVDKEIFYDESDIGNQSIVLCIQYDYRHDYDSDSNFDSNSNSNSNSTSFLHNDVKGEWRIVNCDTKNEIVCEKAAKMSPIKSRFNFTFHQSQNSFSSNPLSSSYSTWFDELLSSGDGPESFENIFKDFNLVLDFETNLEKKIENTSPESLCKTNITNYDYKKYLSLPDTKEKANNKKVKEGKGQNKSEVESDYIIASTVIEDCKSFEECINFRDKSMKARSKKPAFQKDDNVGSILWLLHVLKTTKFSLQLKMVLLFTSLSLLFSFLIILFIFRKKISQTKRTRMFYVGKSFHLKQSHWSHQLRFVPNPIYDV